MIHYGGVIDSKAIEHMLENGDWFIRYIAMKACKDRNAPLELIERGLGDTHRMVRAAAMKACNGRNVPLEFIEQGLNGEGYIVKVAAIDACEGKNISLTIVKKWSKSRYCVFRAAAMKACVGRDVPPELIIRGLKDEFWLVRTMALEACSGKDIPRKYIKRNLKSKHNNYRRSHATTKARESNYSESACRKTFEPPAKVYKRCAHDVTVVAEIPQDAYVRGKPNQKCRASKAKIVDIIGAYCGEKIGISIYNNNIYYLIGDEIEIDDFDLGDDECSTGFHFFCTPEEAENYY